jgi:hypothetical protein
MKLALIEPALFTCAIVEIEVAASNEIVPVLVQDEK